MLLRDTILMCIFVFYCVAGNLLKWLQLMLANLISDNAAGFTPEWATTSAGRVERRQIEVQANSTGNQNTPAEYRTVTSSATQQQLDLSEEERMRNFRFSMIKLTPFFVR